MIGVKQKDWLQLIDLSGFKHHRVSAQVVDIDEKPRVISLHIDVADPDNPVVLTSNQLRDLNLRAIAKAAKVIDTSDLHPQLQDTMREVVKKKPPKRRQVVTVEQVAKNWNLAYKAGISAPRNEVVRKLGITERTASRYIKEAREAGLVPMVWR